MNQCKMFTIFNREGQSDMCEADTYVLRSSYSYLTLTDKGDSNSYLRSVMKQLVNYLFW